MDNITEFYNSWAVQQMNDDNRSVVLKWKAINFLNLLLRNRLNNFNKVCEIGGAEGILLDTLDKTIIVKSLTNYDISDKFCEIGKSLHPKIEFKNYNFSDNPEFYDLILLSDITEHVDNDEQFLNMVSSCCKYLLIKIPVEVALVNSSFFYMLRVSRKPNHLRYGQNHVNGHLRGYTMRSSRKLISKYFSIIDEEISDVAYFSPSKKKNWLKKILGKRIFIQIYGGAYFALAKGHDIGS